MSITGIPSIALFPSTRMNRPPSTPSNFGVVKTYRIGPVGEWVANTPVSRVSPRGYTLNVERRDSCSQVSIQMFRPA